MKNSIRTKSKPNRLIHEKSIYLLQHAYNPVEWYPWCDEAFEKAKIENKPVFVSIGYSTCHWCHVMEKESFEDEKVADLLNKSFVCIKVDREERPDLDSAYMAICRIMGNKCGWPLNVIMTPKKNPFFIATYIPKNNLYGAIGLFDLIPQINKIWRTRQPELELMGKNYKEQIMFSHLEDDNKLGKLDLDDAYDQLFLSFDNRYAGFGLAPKFPSPHNLMFLMRYYLRTKKKEAWTMVDSTLRAMRFGGIFDQVGSGFHRYSTDAKWLVPHFEKMLYDQALLALVYLEAYHVSSKIEFRETAKEILNYALKELISPEGVFFSAEDADSEGEEGKFYLWTQEEIKKILPNDLSDFAIRFFGVRSEGNFYDPHTGKNGKNILHLNMSVVQFASENKLSIKEAKLKLMKIKKILYEDRKKRIHPVKDNKILVDWNGLMITALSKASQVLNEKKYLVSAEKAISYILDAMQTSEGKLFHCYSKGEKPILGFLDDYAFLVLGLIELYEAGFNEKYLITAKKLTETMILEFWDEQKGGFYSTSKSSDKEIPRLKQIYDGAIPSGNSVALMVLSRLALLTDEASFGSYANEMLKTFSYEVRGYPSGYTFMLSALDLALGPTITIVLAGDPNDENTQSMLKAAKKAHLLNLVIRTWNLESKKMLPSEFGYKKINDKTTAYVCKDNRCFEPTTDLKQMLTLIEN